MTADGMGMVCKTFASSVPVSHLGATRGLATMNDTHTCRQVFPHASRLLIRKPFGYVTRDVIVLH